MVVVDNRGYTACTSSFVASAFSLVSVPDVLSQFDGVSIGVVITVV